MEEVTFQLISERKEGGVAPRQVRWRTGFQAKGKNTKLAQRWGKEGLCCIRISAQTFDSVSCTATYYRAPHHNMGIKCSTFLPGLL